MSHGDERFWYRLTKEEALRAFKSDPRTGLVSKDAEALLRSHGANKFSRSRKSTAIDRIVRELKSPLAFILLCAGIVTTALGEYVDATVIFIALIINIAISLYQEGRAGKAFERLSASEERFAVVVRDGEKKRIKGADLVPGDIVVLEAGMSIPADARILESQNLEVNESLLTGEWIDVDKNADELTSSLPLSERKNMVHMGTLVTGGSGRAVVVETGGGTELGKVAALLDASSPPKTPLEENVASIARVLSYIILCALVTIFVLGAVRGLPFTELLLVSIALAVAAIPEGLPAAVTVGLAIGMEALLRRGGLVRNLLAAETLGSTTLIITDKTGTLTKGEMRVAQAISLGTLELETQRRIDGRKEHEAHGDERDVLEFAVLASDAFIEGEGDKAIVRGRPVERAIVEAALASGLDQTQLLRNYPRIDFLPFTSMYKFGVSLNDIRGLKHHRMHISGAPELLLAKAHEVYSEGRTHVLTPEIRSHFESVLKERAKEGMRMIGIAFRDIGAARFPEENIEQRETILEKTVFAGFITLYDPLREDVPTSIKTAIEAGARVVMATGDNPETAQTIARASGIMRTGDTHLLGEDIESMTDEELAAREEHVSVFARMSPEQKLRLVRFYQAQGEVVAMTGDGVNDAPALRAANIGIALGSGTEVSKESSDLILIDGNFSIIVAAIEEGRRIIDNLRKIVIYLLSTSGSEIIVVGGSLIAGLPLPLLPAQILWTNMLSEGFMNFAFAFEPKEDDLMHRDPKVSGARTMLDRKVIIFMIGIGIAIGVLLLGFYWFFSSKGTPIALLRSLMFIVLTLAVTVIAFSLKDLRSSIFEINPFSNRYLLGSLLFALFGLISGFYFEPLRMLLRLQTTDITAYFPLVITVILAGILIVEIAKFIAFPRRSRA